MQTYLNFYGNNVIRQNILSSKIYYYYYYYKKTDNMHKRNNTETQYKQNKTL